VLEDRHTIGRAFLESHGARDDRGEDLLTEDVRDLLQDVAGEHGAAVVERHDDGVTARIGLAYAGVRHAFTTRNEHVSGEAVIVKLVDGPFSLLDGTWAFLPLGRPGSPAQACKVEFDLRYAFASKALETVLSPVFDRVANTFVESFVTRAEAVYGPR